MRPFFQRKMMLPPQAHLPWLQMAIGGPPSQNRRYAAAQGRLDSRNPADKNGRE